MKCLNSSIGANFVKRSNVYLGCEDHLITEQDLLPDMGDEMITEVVLTITVGVADDEVLEPRWFTPTIVGSVVTTHMEVEPMSVCILNDKAMLA